MTQERLMEILGLVQDEEVDEEVVRITNNLRHAFIKELGSVPVFGSEINCAIYEKAKAIVEKRRAEKAAIEAEKHKRCDEANRMMMDYHHNNPLF